ncbi:MFS transporter [Thiotrichales bacterium 19S3-7]|nr:MFS transporter [Thiotrichales bacterium 19S3-7]MCF6801341.1 MFS transporter [Thiotrichales bacterium 19S3-11]
MTTNLKINPRSYVLTLVGYMTLTITMPIISDIAESLNLSINQIQLGISLLFLTFSISAISLASASDIFGTKTVLKYAQLISIIGLIIAGSSYNYLSLLIGFVLVGLGTGCYSSISRAILSRYANDENHMKRSFAILSACVILAPIIASFLAQAVAIISWRDVFYLTAFIEIMLFLYMLPILKFDALNATKLAKKEVFSGFKHIFSKWQFNINVLLVALIFSVYLGVMMENLHPLFTKEMHMDLKLYNIIFLLTSVCYLLGIFLYRKYAHVASKKRYRILSLILCILAVIYITFTNHSQINAAIALLFLCFVMGFIVPLSTGSAMASIFKGHGAAAATLTFTTSVVMSIWSFIQAHLTLSYFNFILLALWVTFMLVAILKVMLLINYKKHITTR